MAGLLNKRFMWHPMFLGEYKQAIDEKGGLLIPSSLALELASGMVITRGFERNLMLFPHSDWQQFAQKILHQPLSLEQSRALRRRMFSKAAAVDIDRRGRIQVPASLCEFAELEGQVVLAGMFNYLEIWNSKNWQPVQEALNISDGGLWEMVGV